MPIQIYSFFAGVGFLDLGFQNAGFDIAFVDENNERFLRAYRYARRNDSHIPQYGYSSLDVRSFLSDDVWDKIFPNYRHPDNTLIGFVGGPPCPDFSVAGRNEGKEGKNGQLTSVYTELIIKRKPDFFLIENVKGLYKTKKHREFYDSIKRKLRRAGYHLFDSIENSLEYGVPQFRERLFLVGFSTKRFGKKVKCNLSAHKISSLQAVMQAPWPTTSPFEIDSTVNCPEGVPMNLTVEYWFEKNNVSTHPNGQDVFGIKANDKFKTICEGATTGKSFKRLHRWRYAPTSAYGNNEVHLHPYKARRISVAEAMAIQSAPEYFSLPEDIPLSAKFKMIGNAVPVLLAQGIAESIRDTILKYLEDNQNG